MKHFLISCGLIFFFSLYCYAGSDSTLHKNNSSAGVTIGHPGGLNLHYGSEISERMELYFFAGAWFSGSYGLKSSLQYKIYQSGNINNYLTLNAGINRNDNNTGNFLGHVNAVNNHAAEYHLSYFTGPGYTLKWNWFMFNCDILIGNKDYRKPKLDLSLGYSYSF